MFAYGYEDGMNLIELLGRSIKTVKRPSSSITFIPSS